MRAVWWGNEDGEASAMKPCAQEGFACGQANPSDQESVMLLPQLVCWRMFSRVASERFSMQIVSYR